jgi:hypothetical protein
MKEIVVLDGPGVVQEEMGCGYIRYKFFPDNIIFLVVSLNRLSMVGNHTVPCCSAIKSLLNRYPNHIIAIIGTENDFCFRIPVRRRVETAHGLLFRAVTDHLREAEIAELIDRRLFSGIELPGNCRIAGITMRKGGEKNGV